MENKGYDKKAYRLHLFAQKMMDNRKMGHSKFQENFIFLSDKHDALTFGIDTNFDDESFIGETRDGVNAKLGVWRQILEPKGFRLSRTKAKYLKCKFSDVLHEDEVEVNLDALAIQKKGSFKLSCLDSGAGVRYGYDIQVGFHDPYQDSVSAMRLYKRMCSQDHPMVGVSNTPDLSFIGSCDPWRTVAHERMTIEELLAISRANYECWCLDSPMHKCSACYKQYKKKDHLLAHMKTSCHSVHDPKCGVCNKHCKSFESLREHIAGPLSKVNCSSIFAERGCILCLKICSSMDSLNKHKEMCHLTTPRPIDTVELYSESEMESYEISNIRSREAVAIDCEIVGGGSDCSLDLCARVCLVNEDEKLIFHTYVLPQIPVTNYRYEITGITEENLRDAMPLKEVRQIIQQILYNGESIGRARLDGGRAKVLVGHNLDKHLDCLKMNYPDHLLRLPTEQHGLAAPPLAEAKRLKSALRKNSQTNPAGWSISEILSAGKPETDDHGLWLCEKLSSVSRLCFCLRFQEEFYHPWRRYRIIRKGLLFRVIFLDYGTERLAAPAPAEALSAAAAKILVAVPAKPIASFANQLPPSFNHS
ncbi:hypothetical protein CQW23_21872 [Capsicum baccatum]|uniref:C2H2-type domain-containing protein n=1 Tax=Capsicum baccatum TaxID=33114 RepID=A0A2G2VZD0_CAPBA|nr:hypothetical protein CQW23_21872 [Capsicum baccatum]